MSSSDEVYCICRSSDVSRFMIGCDHCNDWFHGDCVNISEKESKYIKKYFCKECRKKNSTLSIVYRSKYKDRIPDSLKEKHNAGKDRDKERDKDRDRNKERDRDNDRDRDRDRERNKDRERDKDRDKDRERDKGHSSKDRNRDKRREESSRHHKDKHKDRHRDSDRRDKDRHKDKHRDRDYDKEKEKERERRKEKEREREREKEKERELEEKRQQEKKLKKQQEQEAEEKKKQQQILQKEKELEEEQAKAIKEAIEKQKKEKEQQEKLNQRNLQDSHSSVLKKSVLSERNISEESSDEDVWIPNPPKQARKEKTKSQTNTAKKRKAANTGKHTRKRRGRRLNDFSSDDEDNDDTIIKDQQCFGTNCIQQARNGSKYCSDQCGINLASARIYQVLPERIREWNSTPCAAEEKNRKELEIVREKLSQVKSRLEQLSVEFKLLEDVIAKGKTLTMEDSDDESDDESVEMTILCVTCGANIQTNTAIRHMERCYNKVESQTSFASKFKTQIDDTRMFCDFFNPKEKSYCKRLKVLCPEHNPDPKIGDKEVCGYPLQKELFSKPTSFCLKAKKECQMHFSWEKLRRAELDMERVKQWMKVDELIEEERQIKSALTSRAGVLSLMLHSTFNHDLGRRWQEAHAQSAQKRKMLIAHHQQKKLTK